MTNFDRIIKIIISHEGGYVNDPKDPGGETKYGISKRAYPNLNISNLNKQEAIEIYRRDYWNKIRGDFLPYPVALIVMDIAVLSHPRKAVKMLQKIVGVKQDGLMGEMTLRSLGELRPEFIAQKMTAARIMFYTELPTFHVFGAGWVNRSVETLVEALSNEGL